MKRKQQVAHRRKKKAGRVSDSGYAQIDSPGWVQVQSAAKKSTRAHGTAGEGSGPLVLPEEVGLTLQCVVHVMGRVAGKTLCGSPLTRSDQPNPVQGLWEDKSDGEARAKALRTLRASISSLVGAFPWEVNVCPGCEVNVARMEASAGMWSDRMTRHG